MDSTDAPETDPGEGPSRRTLFGRSILALLAIGLPAALIFLAFRVELINAYYRVRAARATPAEREKLLDELASRGASGRRTIDAIAFDRAPARPGSPEAEVRQHALDVAWANEPDRNALSEERQIRYLIGARGLDRDEALDALRWPQDGVSSALTAAAIGVLLDDPNAKASLTACQFLDDLDDPLVVGAFRDAATSNPHPRTRLWAVRFGLDLGDREGNREALRRALRDLDPAVRIAAAHTLSLPPFEDAAGLEVLIAALDFIGELDTGSVRRLADGLGRTADERAVSALVRLWKDAPMLLVRRIADERLRRFAGEEPPDPDASSDEDDGDDDAAEPEERDWAAWWAVERGAFPEQLGEDE